MTQPIQDQRGVVRTTSQNTSIGAYSANYVPPLEYYYKSDSDGGNWDGADTWTRSLTEGGDYNTTTDAPTVLNTQSVIVINGATVTVSSNVEIDQTTVETGASIDVNSGQTLTIANGDSTDLTVAGTGAIVVNGTLTATGAQIVYSGTGTLNLVQETFSVGTFTAGSGTVIYDGAAQTVTDFTYNNLVLGGSNIKTVGDTLDVDGTFTNTAALTVSTDNLDVEGVATIGADITMETAAATVHFNTTVNATDTATLQNTFDGSTGAITFNGATTIAADKTFTVGDGDTGAISFSAITGPGNLTINSDYTAILTDAVGAATALGTLTLTSGNLNTNTLNITAGAITVNGGTFNSTSAAGTWDLSGDVTIASGAALNATSGTFTVGGNWSNSGTFTPGIHMVTLDGTGQTLSGATSFYNLTKNITSADTLTFSTGSANRTTITNTLNLSNENEVLLSLRSSTSGTQWEIDPQGTRTINYLDVKDSNNVGATNINAVGQHCTDSGNNTKWSFTQLTSGTYYVDTAGKDSNAGTAAAPWKTFHYAIDRINNGAPGT